METLLEFSPFILGYITAMFILGAWEVYTVPACKQALIMDCYKSFGWGVPPGSVPAAVEAKYSTKTAGLTATSPPACPPVPHHAPVLPPAPAQPDGVVQPVQMGSAHYSTTVPGPVVYPADWQDPKK